MKQLVGETAAELATRDQLYDVLHARLPNPPRRLSAFERDGIMQASAAEAARAMPRPSFQLRPGLVATMLRFYDELRRQSQQVDRFEEIIADSLGGESAAGDRGAERLLVQTRFLARAFRDYERRVLASGASDEHVLRARLLAEPTDPPLRLVIVTVADWIADPDGLFAVDFDLLARMPGLEALDIVSTEATLGSGFDERLHNWWPGLEEVQADTVVSATSRVGPVLLTPKDASPDHPWFTYRDREEELLAVARGDFRGGPTSGRAAVVFKHPLPYLYLAPETFGTLSAVETPAPGSGIPYAASDALPLAGEPTSAAVDLVLELAETNFVRSAIVALLRSPHFRFLDGSGGTRPASEVGESINRRPAVDADVEISRDAVSALDGQLSAVRYLGDLGALEALTASLSESETTVPALRAALVACRELAPLLEPAPSSRQLRIVLDFLARHWRTLEEGDPLAARERRGRAAIAGLLTSVANADEAHHDPPWTIDDLSRSVRRWIGEETFAPEERWSGGVQLLDDQAARFGAFDDLAIVGLVENEWPERPRPNIFYPTRMLRSLGWPSERDWRGAADARFLDLVASASRRVAVSTFLLDEDTMVMRSAQLDEIPRAGLSTAAVAEGPTRAFSFEMLTQTAPALETFDGATREWLEMRLGRPAQDAPEFHGTIGPTVPLSGERTWSVSALETYLGCPFKFFAQHVLRLAEEPDDEEVMDPRRQGQLVHEVFEAFFNAWQAAGHGAITPGNIDEARALFEDVVDRRLEMLPPAEAGLERTRLLGSPVAAGLGEAVFRMEAERPAAVVERLLEYRLDGSFSIATLRGGGPRVVSLRGKADRLDLLEDGTFRLIDYKLGWPPNRARALQLPVYGICAEQRLANHRGGSWTLGEAAYLAFKGPKRVVPLFTSTANRDEVLGSAQVRLADTIDAIELGLFPPTPDDVYRCETCSFASVCRKDYVGEV